ncbi:hypothetical protein SUGI_0239380 [Cryptomeria japonica]|nr:hypothetical protein SUGI_0239380 [Cryptomeria japonica]
MASLSNEFDLDSFLELQSSDDDDNDLPALDRSLEEILKDSDDESSSDASENASNPSSYLFRNPNFMQKTDENNTGRAEKDVEKTEGAEVCSSAGRDKIGHESGTSNDSNLNSDYEYGKLLENKDQQTKISDQGQSPSGKQTELKLNMNMKKSTFSDFSGSVRPSPRPGEALAAAAKASRAVPSPHAAVLKNKMANSLSLKSLDTFELSNTSQKTEEVEDELEKEYTTGSEGEISERVFQLDESSSTNQLQLVKSDEEMDEVIAVLDQKEGKFQPRSEDEEFMVQKQRHTIQNQGEEVIDENVEDTSIEQRETGTGEGEGEGEGAGAEGEGKGGGVPDNKSQVLWNDKGGIMSHENEQSSTLVDTDVDTSIETKSTKSSTIAMDDDHSAMHADFQERRNTGKFFPDSTEISIDEKQTMVAEICTENIKLKVADDIVEEKAGKVESNRSARKVGKKASTSLKPLDLAEELEKRDASSGLHWQVGAAAQPMRLEGIRRGPPAIGHLQIDSTNSLSQVLASQMFKRDHGSPQAVAVHINYIALGMSKGSVFVNPSKYSAQSPDVIDTKAFSLSSPIEKSQAAVTSMCFNQQGDLLLVGYGNGCLTLWDLQRQTAAKVISGEHSSPIVHTLSLGQDPQNARQYKAISGDSKGVVLLHTFVVFPLLRRFSVTTQCLFDGQRTGTVLSMSALLVDESQNATSNAGQGGPSMSSNSLGSMMGGVVGGVVGGETGKKLFSDGTLSEETGGVVIFVTQQTALVVRLTPSLEVYAKLPRPDGIREGAMPYTAWRRIPSYGSSSHKSNSNSSNNGNTDSESSGLTSLQEGGLIKVSHDTEDLNNKASLLAIAWDRKVQVAQLVKSELQVRREWNLDSAALGVSWLDEQILVILTSKGQLCLFTKEGMELDRSRLPIEDGGLESALIYHTYFVNSFGNPEKSYHNSMAVRGAAIYLLGPSQLFRSRLLPWKERIQALQDAGDWMGALHLAMELYDGNAQGVIGLPKTLDAMREAIMPFLLQLLSAYVDEAFSYISLAFSNQHGKTESDSEGKSQKDTVHVQIKEQFARVGGVAIEFCVHIKQTDVLFNSVFSKFVGVQHGGTFLELLEPYILKDMLGGLPPEVMQALVEHYSRKGWLQRIEQCVLHMDIASLDFNQVARLCREHGLYSALIYLFNRGLDDFKAPLEELLAVAQDQKRPHAQAFGYKMLVYLKYCFLGLAFPPGHGNLPPDRLPSLRTDLMQFLLERTSTGRSQFKINSEFSSRSYPNLCYLLWLDTEATLEVLNCAFLEDEHLKMRETDLSSLNLYGVKPDNQKLKPALHEIPSNEMKASDYEFPLVQTLIDALTEILEMSFSGTLKLLNEEILGSKVHEKAWPSRKDIGSLLEFIACYVACRHATVSRVMLTRIIEYLASKNEFSMGDTLDDSNQDISRRREKLMFALLKGVPESEWDSEYALELAQNARFYQVSSLIYMLKGQYIPALDSYIKDVGEPIYAFAFISNMLRQLADVDSLTFTDFRSAVQRRIPKLIQLSREATFLLVLEHYYKESQEIISELSPHPNLLFLYLKTMIDVHSHGVPKYPSAPLDNNLNISLFGLKGLDQSKELKDYLDRISKLPEYVQRHGIEVTDEMAELYLELLCQFEPKSVLKFLESFENYRLEHCLRLCQDYGVTDAAAFLLERVGDVGSALSLTISDVTERIREMDSAVASIYKKSVSSISSEDKQLNVLVMMMPEVGAVHAILFSAVGLCQRNTLRLDPQESESLWFRLLDTFSEPSRDLYYHEKYFKDEKENYKKSHKEDLNLKVSLRWKVINVGDSAYHLRRVFAHFIGEIIEGMMGYVPLPVIMSKLLSDNGNQEFGDFKATILGLLGTYGYERTILDTAKNLLEDDAYYNIHMLRKGASHAYAPASSCCCICGRTLDRESFGSSIYIFHCGHVAHFQCETQDSVAITKDSMGGCPICLPKKRSSSVRKKMIEAQKEIIEEASNGVQGQASSSKSLYENALTERPYGLHPQSRFELLNNLQKGQNSLDLGLLPNLRLAPPLVYHDRKAHSTSPASKEEASNEKLKNVHLIRAQRTKSSSPFQFPLKSSIFGNDKNRKH